MMLLPVVAAPGGGGAVSASFAELADFVERQQMLLEQQRAEMEAKMQALVQQGRQDKEQLFNPQHAEYEIAAL